MKKNILLFICFIFSTISFGQTKIFGLLSSFNNSVAADINVLVHPKKNTVKIISFAITDSKGNFSLEFKSNDDTIGISTRSLTYRDTTIWIPNQNQELRITLAAHVREIKEVQVNSRPIIAKKDTITYLVSAFAQVKDQSIGDVISKMPGFEVDQDGKISYQGSPIQKYYIEGLDLLENRYAIANKNLPHGTVGSVEVLENHQPIKALESSVFSDGTSLNLKLKRNIAVTGKAHTGIGLPWLLRDINLTPILFNARQQIIASVQSNNIGVDLNAQNQPLLFSNGVLENLGNIKPELLKISSISRPQIDRQRYLNNNAHLLSYNHLIKVNSLTELKVNAGFYHDRQKEAGIKTSSYYLTSSNYVLREITDNHYYNNNLNASFTLTKNTTKRYLKNQLSINRFWDYEKGVILNPEKKEQKAETPHTSVSNSFDLLIPIQKNYIRIYSLFDYNNSPQRLSFFPGVFITELNGGQIYPETHQNYSQKEIINQQYVRVTVSQKPWSFDTETGIKIELQNQQTFIEKNDQRVFVDSMNNDNRWRSYELYLTETFRYEKNNLRGGIETPLRALTYHLNDKHHHSNNSTNRLLFSPRIWINYDFNGYWSGNVSIRRATNLGDASQLTQGYIINGYRNMQRRSDKLDNKQTFAYSFGLKFKNPVSGVFSSISWIHNQTTKSLLYRNLLQGATGLYFYEAIESDNQSISDNVNMENSWFIANQKITLTMKGNYIKNKREYLLNDSRSWLNNQLILIHPSVGYNRWKKLGLDYNIKLSWNTQHNIQASNTICSQTHRFSLHYYPSDKHWVGADVEYYLSIQKTQSENGQFFANIFYNFKPKNSRLQYKLKCTNLLNASEIIEYRYSDIALFENHYNIRPREIMFTVSFALNR